MQAGVGLLDTDVMPMFMIIALDVIIITCFSINCSAVICSPTIIFSILREASSETYAPRVYFPSYKFPIYYFAIFYFPIYKPKIPKLFILPFVQFHLSLSDLTLVSDRVGIDNPLSRWLRGVICFVQVRGTRAQPPTGLIPWFLKTGGNT